MMQRQVCIKAANKNITDHSLEILFFLHFVLTMVTKCLNYTIIGDYIPSNYIYLSFILFWGLYTFADLIKKRLVLKPCFSTSILIFLLIYYVIWCFINFGDIDQSDALDSLMREVLMIAFVFFSIYWIKRLNCFTRFLNVMYFTFTAYITIWLILCVSEIDILRTLSSFWEADQTERYRVYFGFEYPNLAAEMALSSILLSKIIKKQNINKYLYTLFNLLMFFIILANNSRGTLIAFIFMESIWIFITKIYRKKIDKIFIKSIIIISLGVSIIIIFSLINNLTFLDLLNGTNRQGVTENFSILTAGNKWLFGIGRLSGEFFSSRNYLYGVRSGYLEIFYCEIIVTSGIVGFVFITFLLIWILKEIAKKSNELILSKWILLIFIYMLFISLFEVYFFSYAYSTAIVFLIIILSYIDIPYKNYDKLYFETN